MLCFRSARGAIVAAIGIQRDLTRHGEAFPDEATRVRMGLHTGEVLGRDDGDLFGRHVVVAARIGALAEGGEILVSSWSARSSSLAANSCTARRGTRSCGVSGSSRPLHAVDWHAFRSGQAP